jgi:hypothetical protein
MAFYFSYLLDKLCVESTNKYFLVAREALYDKWRTSVILTLEMDLEHSI